MLSTTTPRTWPTAGLAVALAVAIIVLIVGSAGAEALPSTPAPSPGARDHVRYVHPVDRPILGGFNLPAGQYGAGRRGVEYSTVAGDPVGAAGGGIVTFAGEVAGRMSVTVSHPDGRRSTVTGLVEVVVTKGQIVLSGQVIALAAPHLLLTIREGPIYIDPALLLPRRSNRSRLVPTNAPGIRNCVTSTLGRSGGWHYTLASARSEDRACSATLPGEPQPRSSSGQLR